jgi:hypothetical protein
VFFWGAVCALGLATGCARTPAGRRPEVGRQNAQVQASLERQAELERKVEDLSSQLSDLQRAPLPLDDSSGGRQRVSIRPTPDGSYSSRRLDEPYDEPEPDRAAERRVDLPVNSGARPTLTIEGERARFSEPEVAASTTYRLPSRRTGKPAAPAAKPAPQRTLVEREGSAPLPGLVHERGGDRLPIMKAPVPKVAAAARAQVAPPSAPASEASVAPQASEPVQVPLRSASPTLARPAAWSSK